MADQKISQLTTIVTVDTASDLFPIVDTSAAETKKITPSALKTALALNNVDNTSDANKPISSATQTALDGKQATLVSGTNIKTVNNTSLLGSGNITIAGGGGTWGSITGTLSSQTDLQTALDGKVDENAAITGATKTKITYDAKGLVTAGADATTADIADSTNRRYVTDAQLVVVGNTSGTNTGDNATNSQYSGLATSKQDTLVSGTNIKTINSTSLLGSGDIVISASPSGVAGAIQFSNGSAFASDAANLFWDDTNNRLGVGTNAPTRQVEIVGSVATPAYLALRYGTATGGGPALSLDAGAAGLNYLIISTTNSNGAVGANALGIFDGTDYRVVLKSGNLGIGETTPTARTHIKGSGSTSATTSLLVQNSAGDSSFQVNDSQLVQGFSGSITRFKLGNNGTVGQAISTRDGQFAIGLIDTDQLAAIRFLTLGTGASYIDAYSEGTSKAANYPLFIGSRTNNTSTLVAGSTTQENGTPVVFGSAVYDASALVQINSTTRGFLPPRMTTTQKNAIATPAAGLVVYDTTLAKLCVYTSTWETITSL